MYDSAAAKNTALGARRAGEGGREAGGGGGCAGVGAGFQAPAGRRSARDVGVVLPQRANPGYLTRRAARAEHHLNPRRVRARPSGAAGPWRAGSVQPRGPRRYGGALPRRLSPASAALKVTPCPGCTVAARCTLRLPAGRTGESPEARHPAPSAAPPPRASPATARSPAAGAEQRCTCRHAAAHPGRPAGRRAAPSRRR